MASIAYTGGELELFREAHHWKAYLASELRPFVGGRVLEVGAGIGGTTRAFGDTGATVSDWCCLEPDPAQADHLREMVKRHELPRACRVREGTVGDLPPQEAFDSILYVDVLEHIADDAAELRAAARHLAPGGHLVVLSPAHRWLFSPFDRRVGHHRRYTRASLLAAAPGELVPVRTRYLDAAGLLASLANRVLLRQAEPTPREIRVWDSVLVRASTRVDRLFLYRIGKSVLAVWRRA
jgi:2-polyprenyl-3-methyl-5-hydroxy-6-metoxy-1,4-benzoquinol methylase